MRREGKRERGDDERYDCQGCERGNKVVVKEKKKGEVSLKYLKVYKKYK